MTLVITGPGMAGNVYDGYGGLMKGLVCNCGIGPCCNGGEVVEAEGCAVCGLCDTGVELWKPYGGCGVAVADIAVYRLGVEVGFDTWSIGLNCRV